MHRDSSRQSRLSMSNILLGGVSIAIIHSALVQVYHVCLLKGRWGWCLIIFHKEGFCCITLVIYCKLELVLRDFAADIFIDNLVHNPFVSLIRF